MTLHVRCSAMARLAAVLALLLALYVAPGLAQRRRLPRPPPNPSPPGPPPSPARQPGVGKPNIILILTDDQDYMLNSTHPYYLPMLHKHMRLQGAVGKGAGQTAAQRAQLIATQRHARASRQTDRPGVTACIALTCRHGVPALRHVRGELLPLAHDPADGEGRTTRTSTSAAPAAQQARSWDGCWAFVVACTQGVVAQLAGPAPAPQFCHNVNLTANDPPYGGGRGPGSRHYTCM